MPRVQGSPGSSISRAENTAPAAAAALASTRGVPDSHTDRFETSVRSRPIVPRSPCPENKIAEWRCSDQVTQINMSTPGTASLRYVSGPNSCDLSPHVFLSDVLLAWGARDSNPKPFAIEFMRPKPPGESWVEIVTYNQGTLFESVLPLPDKSTIRSYRVELSGPNVPHDVRSLRFRITENSSSYILSSDWDASLVPNFAWQP